MPEITAMRRKPLARAMRSASVMSCRPSPVCCASTASLSSVAMSCPYTCNSRMSAAPQSSGKGTSASAAAAAMSSDCTLAITASTRASSRASSASLDWLTASGCAAFQLRLAAAAAAAAAFALSAALAGESLRAGSRSRQKPKMVRSSALSIERKYSDPPDAAYGRQVSFGSPAEVALDPTSRQRMQRHAMPRPAISVSRSSLKFGTSRPPLTYCIGMSRTTRFSRIHG
mmetsp:Transcript_4118/g.6866  ORF Transcript_4118/g.6866 Transcript_4118/m.6866 type:complete len:229 (+) Transcript_4118:153-839(+)